jgi:transmembrane sensor
MSIDSDMDDTKTPLPRVQAERWFARLRAPDCEPGQRQQFQRWQQQPEHADAYARTEALWDELGALAGNAELQRQAQQLLRATEPLQRSQRPRWREWALAASLLVSVAVGAALWWSPAPLPAVPQEIHATVPGQTRSIALADGSQLTLNTDTEVAVSLEPQLRRLELRRGEALFEVAHDARRPFVVTIGNDEVRALGTRFQVRRDPAAVTVTLLQGRVAVARASDGEQATLTPGEQLQYAAQGAMQRRMIDPEIAASWTRGRLIFRATPLAEALAEVNRYATPAIVIRDPQLAQTPISGSVKVGDGRSMALALSRLLELQVQAQQDGSLLLSRR